METAGKDSGRSSNIRDEMETAYPLPKQLKYYTQIQETKPKYLSNRQFRQAFSEKTDITLEEFKQQCRMKGCYTQIKDINISLGGVLKLLEQLNPYTAAGPDN
jgi:methylphosphotriester-DNA--protein-cysteine methyltransferase